MNGSRRRILSLSVPHFIAFCLVFVLSRGLFVWNLQRLESIPILIPSQQDSGSQLAATEMKSVVSLRLHGDGFSYLYTAHRIRNGSLHDYFNIAKERLDELQTVPPYWRTPIFREPLQPLYLAATIGLFPNALLGPRVVNIVLALLSALLGMSILRKVASDSKHAVTIFAWVSALYPEWLVFSGTLASENLEYFLFILGLWMIVSIPKSRSIGFCLLLGAVTGLFMSIKAYWVYMTPVTALLLWSELQWLRFSVAKRVLCLVAFVSLVVAVITPTLVRNYRYSDGGLMLASKMGFNLWKSNNHFTVENHDFAERTIDFQECAVAAAEGHGWPEGVIPPCPVPLRDFEACEAKRMLRFVLSDPLNWLRRAVQKNLNLWSPNSFILNPVAGPYYFGTSGGAGWTAVQAGGMIVYFLAMVAFILGVAQPAQTRRAGILKRYFIACLLLLSVAVAVGHGMTRLRMPLMSGILIFGAMGISSIFWSMAQQSISRRRRLVIVTLMIVFTAAIVSKAPKLLGAGPDSVVSHAAGVSCPKYLGERTARSRVPLY